jgi:hypothetical protein
MFYSRSRIFKSVNFLRPEYNFLVKIVGSDYLFLAYFRTMFTLFHVNLATDFFLRIKHSPSQRKKKNKKELNGRALFG